MIYENDEERNGKTTGKDRQAERDYKIRTRRERKNGERSRFRGEQEQTHTIGYQKRPLFIKLCLGGIEGLNPPSGFLTVLLQD